MRDRVLRVPVTIFALLLEHIESLRRYLPTGGARKYGDEPLQLSFHGPNKTYYFEVDDDL